MIQCVIIRVSWSEHAKYMLIPTHFNTSPDTITICKQWDLPLPLTEGPVSITPVTYHEL